MNVRVVVRIVADVKWLLECRFLLLRMFIIKNRRIVQTESERDRAAVEFDAMISSSRGVSVRELPMDSQRQRNR